MRAFMVLLSIGWACAIPQGYNYQIEVGPTGTTASGSGIIQAVPNGYQQQIIQQYSPQIEIHQQQQEQPQFVYQEQFAGQIPQFTQGFIVDEGNAQFGNTLLQNVRQAFQFEQQQQIPAEPQLQRQVQAPAAVVEAPPKEVVQNVEANKPIEVTQAIDDSQPQFIIKMRAQPQPTKSFQTPEPAQKKITFQKEFYYLSAPQEEYETPKELEDQLTTIKKNLRVVFIKAPENNGLENAVLQLAKQSANAQTAIYVLTKQHDASALADKLKSVQSSTPQRPEVSFIKYRTPEEAEHAQRVIQAQYEALDGPNHINRPVTGVTHNFVGSSAASVDPRKSSAAVGETIEIAKPLSKYLPTLAKH